MDLKLQDENFEVERKVRSSSQNLTDFFKNTKLYGICYLGERRTKIEKVYWLVFICLSTYFSVTTIKEIWTQWNKSPVVILTQNSKPIWEVPFPAVTICPETKIQQSVYNFTHYYHEIGTKNVTSEELETFSYMSLFCDDHLYNFGNKTTSYGNVMKLLRDVSPNFQKTFFSCKWLNLKETCETLFTPVVTEEGLCFSFNMLERQEMFNNIAFFDEESTGRESQGWSLDGYTNKSIQDTFPRRTTTTGFKNGLTVLLSSYQDDFDYVCRGPVQGFKVFLHQPNGFPRTLGHYVRAPLDQEILVAVEPNLRKTSQNLISYSPNERGCFFPEERQLKFFRNYSQNHCWSECLAEFTLSRCGCLAYYMPHEENTEICGSGSNTCVFNAEHELLVKEAESSGCNCLPACTSLSYRADTSQADFNYHKVFQAFNADINEFPGLHMTRVSIFFKSMQFYPTERSASYDGHFLASCGGLLAFFCGFSFLTVAEIIYFLTLKIVCSFKQFRGNYK